MQCYEIHSSIAVRRVAMPGAALEEPTHGSFTTGLDLTWSAHTDAVLKKAHQRLFFLRRLRKFGTSQGATDYKLTADWLSSR